MSDEAREKQCISLATDLAMKQMEEGTASAQVIVHFLKLATARERLEQAKIEQELELMAAKADAIRSEKRIEELYGEAIKAMSRYRGEDLDDSYDETL